MADTLPPSDERYDAFVEDLRDALGIADNDTASVEPAKRGTLLIRKTTKQSWSQASQMDMKDTAASLTEWAEAMNADLGWKKYDVKEQD